MNNIIFGQFYETNSWIHRLDPRTKIGCLFFLMIGVFLVSNLYIQLVILLLSIILILSSKVPFAKYLNSVKMISTLLLFTFVFQVLFNKNGDLIYKFDFTLNHLNITITIILLILFIFSRKIIKKQRLSILLVIVLLSFLMQSFVLISPSIVDYSIKLYDSSLFTALKILIRVLSLVCLSSTLTLCTKPTDLTIGLEKILNPLKKIKIDVSILAMLISIALRFIPTLINEAYRILKAQASRGVDFNEGRLSRKVTQVISLLVPMFVIAYKKAEDLANAMEAKSYIPGADRTSLRELKYNLSDYLTYAISILLFASMIVLKVIL